VNLKSQDVLDYYKFKGKINANSFVELIKANPSVGISGIHEGQQKIFDAYEERVPAGEEARSFGLDFEYKYTVLCAICGRRFGKSVAASILGSAELLVPNAKVMIVSYTLDNASVIFDMIYKIIGGLGVELTVNRRKDMELELINGSTLRVASVDNVESKLGTSISLLILDEAKLFKKDLYYQVLRPMLLDYSPLSRTILITSPADNWIREEYEHGQDTEDPRWARYWSVNLPTHTNPTIPRSILKEMEETMPRSLYEMEVLGLFTSKHGAVFPEFDKDIHVYSDDDYPFFREWLRNGNGVVNTIDSGYTHYFAGHWFLYVEELDTYFVFEEYLKNKTPTPVHADNIKRIEEEWGVDVMIRYADPAASQQLADFAQHDLYFNKSDKNLRETINNMNTLFFQRSEVTGKPKLLISKRCVETIRELREIQWKEDAAGQTREQTAAGVKPFKPDTGNNKTDWDAVDSLRYGLHSFNKNNQMGMTVFESFLGGVQDEEDEFTHSMNSQGYFRFG
jgi:hypothetical protein